MEELSVTTPADVISLVGHSLGYWPAESLVCIALDAADVGVTLRVDLPADDDGPAPYVRKVAECLLTDHDVTAAVLCLFTGKPWKPGDAKPFHTTVQALRAELAGHRVPVRDGWLIGQFSFTNYFCDDPGCCPAIPVTATQTSRLNAELIYRGSNVQPTDAVALPARAPAPVPATAVEQSKNSIATANPGKALAKARTLWASLLDSGTNPTLDQTAELLADFQFAQIRDRLIADIPGIDEPLPQILLAQTEQGPHWARVERAEQILLHLYTHGAAQHVPGILTALAYISWWQGKSSKAVQFIDLALDADPQYRLAQLVRRMLDTGAVAGWATDKHKAYRPRSGGPQASLP